MEKVGFIGFGELGKQIFNRFLGKGTNFEEKVFIFDDDLFKNRIDAFPFNDFLEEEYKELSFVVSIGYKHLGLKNSIIGKLLAHQRTINSFIHPSSFISNDFEVNAGIIIYPMCTIDVGVSIGSGTLLNNAVTVSHDSKIGSCCYLSPGVIISGRVTIGENCFIGAGCTIADNITIGNNVTIGIGTVVVDSIPDNMYAIGNPMRIVNHLKLR